MSTTVESPALSVTERLAEEVAAETGWPADAPPLKPLLTLSRRERAAVVRQFGTIMPKLHELERTAQAQVQVVEDPNRPARNAGRVKWAAYALTKNVEFSDDMGRDAIIAACDAQARLDAVAQAARDGDFYAETAAAMELAADLEDFLALLAADVEEFRAWSAALPDRDMISLFVGWSRSAQLGEALSSPS